jgi:cobalt-zinc-cadmium efflux system protein
LSPSHASTSCCASTPQRGVVHGMRLSSKAHAWRLTAVFALNLGYGFVEVWGSISSNSWALMSDAFHMFADASGLLLALLGAVLSLMVQKNKDYLLAFRMENVSSTLNALGLWMMSFYLWTGGVNRLFHPVSVQVETLFWVAFGGLLINGASMWLFHRDQKANLNMRGAYLHMLSDALGSVAAILSAGCLYYFEWQWIDPSMSLLVALLVTVTAFHFSKGLWRQWQTTPNAEAFDHPILHEDESLNSSKSEEEVSHASCS